MLLVATGLGAAASPIVTPPQLERLVEGHTVFTVIEPVAPALEKGELAAAVAVLVRERSFYTTRFRFPGVLWFNDQYLVDPVDDRDAWDRVRYPCSGAVLVVNAGDPDPRILQNASLLAGGYVESYRVTDPNEFVWEIDKWNVSRPVAELAVNSVPDPSRPDNVTVWTVHLLQGQLRTLEPDNGECNRNPVKDGARKATNPNGYGYPCGGNGGPACQSGAWYNAVVFFFLEDLFLQATPKNHTEGSSDSTNDVSGCHRTGSPQQKEKWPCPGGPDDDREGNSHPYNPEPLGMANLERNSHGYSDDCTGDGLLDFECHATRRVDVYYGTAPRPLVRTWRVTDDIGGDAPYHCHDEPTTDVCNDPPAGGLGRFLS